MDIYQRSLINYYNSIVSDEMRWSYHMHCIVEDGNLEDEHLEMSVSDVKADEFVVLQFLQSIPYEVRRFVWENKRC